MRFSFSLLAGLLFISGLQAQDCECDHTIDTRNTTSIQQIKATDYTYSPGDVFCVLGGNSGGLRFIDFKGSEEEPLIIKNCEGQVVIEEGTYSGIAFWNCQYIHLTGTGSEEEYGFWVKKSGGGSSGVGIGNLSSDVEVDHIHIQNTGFAGIMAKTDPNCEKPETWRRNGFVMRNIHVHHNYIHNTGGEGMYIGYTGGYKVTSNKTCGEDGYVFGHLLENVNIHHNRLENTGWDGIQVNLTTVNAKIHHNELIGFGLENQTWQTSGMSLGASDFEVYNNLVYQNQASVITGSGMTVITALSGSKFHNNVIIGGPGNGIFAHNRYPFENQDTGYYFMHNTIVETAEPGIFYNGKITHAEDANLVGNKQLEADIRFYNNLVLNPGVDYASMNFWKKDNESFIDFIDKDTRDIAIQQGNVFSRNADTLGLYDPVSEDFRIYEENSDLIDGGVTIPFFAPEIDFADNDRVIGVSADVGAYEYAAGAINNIETNTSDGFTLFPNPTRGKVFLETKKEIQSIIILDNQGRTLEQVTGNSFTLLNYRAGIYLICFQTVDGEEIYQRIVKY